MLSVWVSLGVHFSCSLIYSNLHYVYSAIFPFLFRPDDTALLLIQHNKQSHLLPVTLMMMMMMLILLAEK